jgi:hypothetical protein
MKRRTLFVASIAFCLSLLAIHSTFSALAETRFEISYPAALEGGPITGRAFVIVSKTGLEAPPLEQELQTGKGSIRCQIQLSGQDNRTAHPSRAA